MKNYDFLFWAYTVVWVGIVGYLVFLASRLERVGRKLEKIEAALSKRETP